jgi:hypothetical protein
MIELPANRGATRYLRIRWVAVFPPSNIWERNVCEACHGKLLVWMQGLHGVSGVKVMLQ